MDSNFYIDRLKMPGSAAIKTLRTVMIVSGLGERGK